MYRTTDNVTCYFKTVITERWDDLDKGEREEWASEIDTAEKLEAWARDYFGSVNLTDCDLLLSAIFHSVDWEDLFQDLSAHIAEETIESGES